MLQTFGYISGVLSIIMVMPEIWGIFFRTTKPQRASWFIWSILGFIAFFSQLAKGATNSLWLTAGQTIAVLIIFALSIKYGVGGITKRDIKALFLAFIGLILWAITKEALYALLIVILVDCIGIILTAIKVYKDPQSESIGMWILSGISGVFGALAVGSFNFVLLAYPLYIAIDNFVIVILMILRKRRILSNNINTL